MNAEEFYKTQWTCPEKMDEFYKCGIRFSYNDMIKFAKDYAKQANGQESEQKQLTIPDIMFSEARAEVCKRFDYWKTCKSWKEDCRCLAQCEYHLQT